MASGDSPSPGCGAPPWGRDRPDWDISLWVEVVWWDPWPGTWLWGREELQLRQGQGKSLCWKQLPYQSLPPQCLGASSKVTMGKGPPLAAVALRWPPAPAAQASWPPADALITLTAELTIRLSQTTTSQWVLCYSFMVENSRQEMTATCTHQFGWAEFCSVGSVAMSVLVNEPCLQHFAGSFALEKTRVNGFLNTFLGCIFSPYSSALPFLWKRKVKLGSNPKM